MEDLHVFSLSLMPCLKKKKLTKSYKLDASYNVARIPSVVSMYVLEDRDLICSNCSTYWVDMQTLIKYVRIDEARSDACMNPSTWKVEAQESKIQGCLV